MHSVCVELDTNCHIKNTKHILKCEQASLYRWPILRVVTWYILLLSRNLTRYRNYFHIFSELESAQPLTHVRGQAPNIKETQGRWAQITTRYLLSWVSCEMRIFLFDKARRHFRELPNFSTAYKNNKNKQKLVGRRRSSGRCGIGAIGRKISFDAYQC